MAKPTTPRATRKPSHVLSLYLILYNLASAAAWVYVLYRCWAHMAGLKGGYTGIKERLGAQDVWETTEKRARSGVDDFGHVVKWVQTAAVLEAVHSALRLVRSPLGTTVAQIFSRLALVWGVCEFFPEVPHSPIYISMVTAWSFAEIIRYIHYATGLAGVKSKALEWLRYTAFYILYPVGAGSEAALIAFSAPYAKEKYGALAQIGVYAFVAVWPPSLFFLMSYMHAQRRKHLSARRPSSSSSPSIPRSSSTPSKSVAAFLPAAAVTPSASSSATAANANTPSKAPKDITSKLDGENVIKGFSEVGPARSTRSRAKKGE